MRDDAVPQGEAIHVEVDPEAMLRAYLAQRRRLARTATGVRADPATALVVDALAGRGTIEDAFPDADATFVEHVGRLARRLAG